MKRYLLFSGDYYYPCGGMDDFIGDFDTYEDAVIAVSNKVWDWAHVYDTKLKKQMGMQEGQDMITITTPMYEVEVKDGRIQDTTENGKFFLDTLKGSQLMYEVVNEKNWDGVPEIMFIGTFEALLPLLVEFDPNGRDADELRDVLDSWDKTNEELWNKFLY